MSSQIRRIAKAIGCRSTSTLQVLMETLIACEWQRDMRGCWRKTREWMDGNKRMAQRARLI